MKMYNTLSQKMEDFAPLSPPKVSMYVCGPTVYNHSHIGHGRTYLSYDMIVRYLEWKGYAVQYVRNITDIDDKIIHRAQEEGVGIDQVSNQYTQSFHDDLARLHLRKPNVEPRATETVAEMIEMINSLVQKKFAYVSQGDVYFSVKTFSSYGKLSKKNIEDLQAGARVAPGELKRDPLDFALWKASKEGEPSWDSPWGKGRPGWHIECSAMSKKVLGETIDIHAGGRDLIFPHHENEIAQSECANQKPFARFWLHNGFVNLSKEKMSKSLGNVILLKDIFTRAHPDVFRFYILSSHYRSPIEFSYDDLSVASVGYDRMMRILLSIPHNKTTLDHPKLRTFTDRFDEAMAEDFNTPKAMAVLFELAREINRLAAKKETLDEAILHASHLFSLGNVLGLFATDPKQYFRSLPGMENLDVENIEMLIAKRLEMRREKKFLEADQIRNQLSDMGIQLEDAPEGTTWKKVK